MDEVRRALEEQLGRSVSHREQDTIALGTRAAKTPVDPIGSKNEWLTRADRVGFDIDACFDRATCDIATHPDPLTAASTAAASTRLS